MGGRVIWKMQGQTRFGMAKSRDLEFSGFFLLLSVFHFCLVGLSLYVSLSPSAEGFSVLPGKVLTSSYTVFPAQELGRKTLCLQHPWEKSQRRVWSLLGHAATPGPHTVGSQGIHSLVCIPCQFSQWGWGGVRPRDNDRQKVPQSKRSWQTHSPHL